MSIFVGAQNKHTRDINKSIYMHDFLWGTAGGGAEFVVGARALSP